MIQVQLRHKYARLLGYSNYADYVVDLRMAKTPSKVYIMFPFPYSDNRQFLSEASFR